MSTALDAMAEGWFSAWAPLDRRPASQWAAEYVVMPGGAFGDRFDPKRTPWNVYPVDLAGGFLVRTFTHVKPVQSGGSLAGECALCAWIGRGRGGDIQYNWSDNEAADKRWDKRIEKILRATPPVSRLFPSDRNKVKRGSVIFDRFNLTVQGVFTEDNLDSDSIRYQINEEVHSWEPGRLEKAYNRTTAFLDSCVRFNISNASKVGDQLHQAFLAGTQQYWEVRCPGCGLYHAMHAAKHKDGRPGGLRYDSAGCKREDGSYDYNKLAGTIFYEFDCCGFRLPDDRKQREALSQTGRYSDPQNTGAPLTNRSTTLEAVAVHYIPWLELIHQKHSALRALRLGDPTLWWQYVAERECHFYDPDEDRPIVGAIILNAMLKKNRDGLPNRIARFAGLDYQRGKLAAGEAAHWWAVIRDVDAQGNSLLVWEGKCLTDEDMADVLRRHEVHPACVAADSGHDAVHVYSMCMKYGWNAIKGAGEASFAHSDGSRRIFSLEKPLYEHMGLPPTRENLKTEPFFFQYSKSGIRERLHWLRGSKAVRWDVPGDVSEAYRSHMESEEYRERKHPRTGETIGEWVQVKKRNDLFVCECYVALLMDASGIIGQMVEQPKKAA